LKAKHAVIDRQSVGDVEIMAVAGELRQVFANLISNSLDAIEEKGTIKLRVSAGLCREGCRCVRVIVADNGGGIHWDAQPHVFEPFYTTKGSVGTGLGLWVSKQIIEKHGGTIRVRSRTDGNRRGTTISITLPLSLRNTQESETEQTQLRLGA
jgi:signal transduction histidine kinase